ncbi:MAG: hypothetical protein ABW213_12340 [Tardiphaga sp.]
MSRLVVLNIGRWRLFVNEMAIQIRDRGHQDGAAARHVRRMNSCLAIEAPISAGKVQRSDGRE